MIMNQDDDGDDVGDNGDAYDGDIDQQLNLELR